MFCRCPEQTCPIHTSNIPSTKSHIHFVSLRSFIDRICPDPRLLENFRDKLIFYGEELLAPRPTPKLEDHPLSVVRDCLFNIFATTLHTWRASPPFATWGRAIPWWQGTHLTWSVIMSFKIIILEGAVKCVIFVGSMKFCFILSAPMCLGGLL
jgi:hypothetical protein